ncbi:MAG TPA: hypothetical protein VK205_11875 [Prolixibacteraceae bacterium]|nr:hypothetical protein [Prolixibacteraceae bacterium]
MVKKSLLLFITFFSLQLSFGQVIHLQFGPSISNLQWSVENIRRIGSDKTLTGRSAFIGLDYLNSRHFNLSTNVGYLQKGDRSDIAYIKGEGDILVFPAMKALFEYFSFNTVAEIKLPISKRFIPYISFGPRVDYLFSYTKDFSFIEEINQMPRYAYGANAGGGIKLDFRRLQVGVRSDYYFNLNKMANWGSNSDTSWIEDTTYLVNLTVGYKLR